MKILFYTDLFIPFIGGNESYLANVEERINHLPENETIHVTSRIEDTSKEEVMKWNDHDVPVKRATIPFRNNFLGIGRYFFPFTSVGLAAKEAKERDIIHATTFIAGLSGWVVARRAKKPVVLFAHELFGPLWKTVGENPIQKYIYPLVEKFIVSRYRHYATCSEYGKMTLERAGADPDKITVINHGVDPQFHPGIDGSELRKKFGLDNNLVFGFSGRLKVRGTGQSKGLPDLLKAAQYVFKVIPEARLVLGGSDFEDLIPIIKELDIEDKVIHTGRLPYPDVPKFHAMCDIIAGASIAEGFGLFYAEASRCGKAVAATKAGAIPEVIIDGETGLLSEPRDPKALALNIIKLLLNKELRDKYAKAGAEYAKKFDWDKSAQHHLDLYKKIIKKIN